MLETRDAAVRFLATIWEFFLEIALGIVVLWLFFLVMGAVELGDPLWLTIAIGILGLMALVHIAHRRRAVDEDPELSRRVHRFRERRGF
jgi:hypothetical protein